MRPERTRPARLAAVLVALLVVAACGDDDGEAATTTTSTTTTSEPSTTEGTEAPEAEACPEDPAPQGEERGAALVLDADGDAAQDEMATHVVEPGTVEVVVTHGAGGRSVLEIADENVATFAEVRVATVADVDEDGDDDAWVVVGAGAAVEIATLVLADGCDLVRAEVDGRGSAFTFGASVAYVAGIECVDGGGFLTHEAENAGDTTYRGTSTSWSVGAAGALERVGTEPLDIDLADPGQARFTTLDCG